MSNARTQHDIVTDINSTFNSSSSPQVRIVAGPPGEADRAVGAQIWRNPCKKRGHHDPACFSTLHDGEEVRLDHRDGQGREEDVQARSSPAH